MAFELRLGIEKQDEVPSPRRARECFNWVTDVPAGGIMAKMTFQMRVRKCMM